MTHQGVAVHSLASHHTISLLYHPTVPSLVRDGRSASTSPSTRIQAAPTCPYPDARLNGVQAFKFTCAVLQKPSILVFFARCNRVLSSLYWTFTSASFPSRCPILYNNRMLFVVLCIHICAVLEKDPSKFHMSLEFARVLLERGADMEAQDDDDKCIPLLL